MYGTTRSLVIYSAEEYAWLTEAVTADIVTTTPDEAKFTGFTEQDAEFTDDDKKIISGAVATYFKKRVAGAWTETGGALVVHAVTNINIKRDIGIRLILLYR